jgi:hypothetical protein
LQDASQDIQFTILSRQAMGTHSRDEGMIEQMLHRALAQDDGRGLAEPNNDMSRLEVVVYMMVQPLEPSVRMGRRLALALQHQPRILHGEAKGGAKAWGSKHRHTFFPLTSQLPHNIHLLSFKARDSITDDIILRLVHIFEAGQHSSFSQSKSIEWDSIFSDFSFESKRERSLAMSMDVDFAQARRPRYTSSGKLDHASGITPKFVKQESQNTQEEGVFISQAALDDKKKVEDLAMPAPTVPTGRKLQALGDDDMPRNDAVVFLDPMQIKSFFVQLVPKRSRNQGSTTQTIEIRPTEGLRPTKSSQQKISGESAVPSEADPDEIVPHPTPPSIQVSDLELRAFLLISVVGTGLVILAYVRLRRRNNKFPNSFSKNRKGLIEV